MKTPSEVLISIDVARALEADIKFYLSPNGVVVTPGNEMGYLERRFFLRVERVKVSANTLPGWERRDEDKANVDEAPPSVPIHHRSPKAREQGKVRPAAEFLRHLYRRFF